MEGAIVGGIKMKKQNLYGWGIIFFSLFLGGCTANSADEPVEKIQEEPAVGSTTTSSSQTTQTASTQNTAASESTYEEDQKLAAMIGELDSYEVKWTVNTPNKRIRILTNPEHRYKVLYLPQKGLLKIIDEANDQLAYQGTLD